MEENLQIYLCPSHLMMRRWTKKGQVSPYTFFNLAEGEKCAQLRNSSNYIANSLGMNFVMENKLIAIHWGWRSEFHSFTEFVTTTVVKICFWTTERLSFFSSPGSVLWIVYLEHDLNFNFNSWTVSHKIYCFTNTYLSPSNIYCTRQHSRKVI